MDAALKNYSLIQDTLDEIKEGKDEYALKAVGLLNSMEKFSMYFGLQLSHFIFSATEQLSIALQGKETSLQQAVQASRLTIGFLARQRDDNLFNTFYSRILGASDGLTNQPILPRLRRPPRRRDSASSAHVFETPQAYYKQQYFEALDIVVTDLHTRFQQDRGMPLAALLEKTLLDAANGSFTMIPTELEIYKCDVNIDRLTAQLKMLPEHIRI